MRPHSDGRRYPWIKAVEDIALDLAERATTEAEFMRLWALLGEVVRYLTTHDPRPDGEVPMTIVGAIPVEGQVSGPAARTHEQEVYDHITQGTTPPLSDGVDERSVS